jgi:diadenosine tetraphosphate (Ap4A) HIT family hydrolase
MAYDRNNVFAKILRGELPCNKVYEDEFALAFHDIRPLTPVHVLVIPKGEFVSFIDFAAKASTVQIAGFWHAVANAATALGLDANGYRLVANSGADAHQIVFHFHVHIFAGRKLSHQMGNMPKANQAES